MANAYVRSFTSNQDYELKEDWLLDDVHEQFPYEPCDPIVNDGKPMEGLVCWMDQRTDADRAEATCPSSFDTLGGVAISRTVRIGWSGGSRPKTLLAWSSSALALFFFVFA